MPNVRAVFGVWNRVTWADFDRTARAGEDYRRCFYPESFKYVPKELPEIWPKEGERTPPLRFDKGDRTGAEISKLSYDLQIFCEAYYPREEVLCEIWSRFVH